MRLFRYNNTYLSAWTNTDYWRRQSVWQVCVWKKGKKGQFSVNEQCTSLLLIDADTPAQRIRGWLAERQFSLNPGCEIRRRGCCDACTTGSVFCFTHDCWLDRLHKALKRRLGARFKLCFLSASMWEGWHCCQSPTSKINTHTQTHSGTHPGCKILVAGGHNLFTSLLLVINPVPWSTRDE